MSSTKVVIVVLVLVALLFVILVTKGALSKDKPKPGNKAESTRYSKKEKPGWAKAIKGLSNNRLFSSVVPKVVLKQKGYSSSAEENVLPDKKPFRTATFRLVTGAATIKYEDHTKDAIDNLKSQPCPLPNFDSDDIRRCTIIALKGGGTLTFSCQPSNVPCRVDVE